MIFCTWKYREVPPRGANRIPLGRQWNGLMYFSGKWWALRASICWETRENLLAVFFLRCWRWFWVGDLESAGVGAGLGGLSCRRRSPANKPKKKITSCVLQSELCNPQISNLWWMPNSVSKGFDTAVKMGSSRRFKRYPTTYRWVSRQLPIRGRV